MKKLHVAIFLFLVSLTSNAQPFNEKLAAKLQSTLDTLVKTFSNNTKGVAAGVYCPGQGQWTGASGISYPGQPITTEMCQGIASNSKLFSAVAILKLCESKILNLNDPLSKWIASYKNVSPNITIRQLLNHTSGLSDPFLTTALLDTLQRYPKRFYTPQDILALLGPPTKAPGAGYNYSNVNYILAGMVVQSATGRSIAKLLRDSLFTPLHLQKTFYDIEEAEIGIVAYRWHNGADLHDSSRVSLNSAGGPAGSIFSTPADMLTWYTTLMRGGVLQPASFTELTNFLSPQNYGLGLQKTVFYGRDTWGHAGSFPGYKSRVIHDPCMQATVCCLSNDDWSAVDGITALLYKAIIDNVPLCPGLISGLAAVCQGQTEVTYSIPVITNASSYVWAFPDGSIDTTVTNVVVHNYGPSLQTGVLSVRGLNDYGLGMSSSLHISVQVLSRSIAHIGMTLVADSSATAYQWLDCDKDKAPISGATDRRYDITKNGSYAVELRKGSCIDTSDCVPVTVSDVSSTCTNGLRIESDCAMHQINVYFGGASTGATLRLFDLRGQTVMRCFVNADQSIIIDSRLSPGLYIAELVTNNGISIHQRYYHQ